MCDEFTAIDDDKALAERGLNRRQFAAMSAATVAAMSAGSAALAQGGPAAPDPTLRKATTESNVTVPTPDGSMDAFFVHPVEGKSRAIIMYPDIGGLRPAYNEMARELAARGYAVLAVNHYYRSAKAPVVQSISEFFTPEGRARLQPMTQAITTAGIQSDAKAIVAWLDAQEAVDATKKIGAEGYCMTGSYAIRAAEHVPERIGAASSFHGGGLVTPAPDSPHKLLRPTAYYLIAIARNDDERAPNDKEELRLASENQGAGARIEVYAADHGWCTIDSAAYQKVEANRAREMSLFHYAKL